MSAGAGGGIVVLVVEEVVVVDVEDGGMVVLELTIDAVVVEGSQSGSQESGISSYPFAASKRRLVVDAVVKFVTLPRSTPKNMG